MNLLAPVRFKIGDIVNGTMGIAVEADNGGNSQVIRISTDNPATAGTWRVMLRYRSP